MHVTGATAVSPPHPYTGPAKLAADNDGDGRKGAAALNDGDAAARRANAATAQSAHSTSRSQATARSVDVKA
jgi:hypothetical protein